MRSPLPLFGTLAALWSAHACGGWFDNLSFESPTFVPASTIYPWAIEPSAALHSWTAYWDTNLAPYVTYDAVAMDSVNIALLDTNAPYGYQELSQTFHGQYTLLLQGGFAHRGDPLARLSASIAQAGLVPLSAKSLTFYARGSDFGVTLGGQNLTLHALGLGPGYTIYGADVSGFAGQETELRFTAYPTDFSPSVAINNVYLDAISFSSLPIPVPLTISPGATNTLVLYWPAPPSSFLVQQSLTLNTNWVTLTNSPAPAGSGSQLTIPLPSAPTFFRLISQ